MPNTNPIFRPSAVQLIEMIRKLERRIRVLETSEGIFDINNENTPATLGASQNNYDPGNYDILRLSSSAAYNITGISGGVKGRRLQLFNIGAYAITLSNLSASSSAWNRFNFVNASDFVIPPNGTALLYYDSTLDYWIGGDMSSIYDVVNENTPAQLNTDQNNYDIGLYEVLRLSSSSAVTITGISGGVKGRSLRLINVGSYAITLAHENASSTAANRIKSSSENNVVIYPNAFEDLYYDSTLQRWTLPFSFRITNRQGGSSSNWNTVGTTNYDLVAGGKVQVGVAEIVIVAAQTGSVVITYPSAYTNPPWANISRRYISADLGAGDYVADFGIGTITNTQMTVQIGLNAVATSTIKIYWITIGV